VPVAERRRLQGTVESVDGDTIVILYENDQRLEIPFSSIARGRIVPDYDALLRGQGLKN
jgi:ribosome maturation factor RimP